MTIKIYQEKDKSYGARIQIGKHIIYAVGDTFEDLQYDIKNGMECAFSVVKPEQKAMAQNFLHMLYSPVLAHAA